MTVSTFIGALMTDGCSFYQAIIDEHWQLNVRKNFTNLSFTVLKKQH